MQCSDSVRITAWLPVHPGRRTGFGDGNLLDGGYSSSWAGTANHHRQASQQPWLPRVVGIGHFVHQIPTATASAYGSGAQRRSSPSFTAPIHPGRGRRGGAVDGADALPAWGRFGSAERICATHQAGTARTGHAQTWAGEDAAAGLVSVSGPHRQRSGQTGLDTARTSHPWKRHRSRNNASGPPGLRPQRPSRPGRQPARPQVPSATSRLARATP